MNLLDKIRQYLADKEEHDLIVDEQEAAENSKPLHNPNVTVMKKPESK